MWRYRYSDELYHGDHKYIAKIGQGIKAKYFYTQEALDAYKKALSSKDEKAALNKAVKNERATVDDIHKIDDGEIRDLKNAIKNLDGKDLKKQLFDLTKKGAEKKTAEARAKTEEARKAYAESQTLKGKAKALAEVHKSYNPESAAKFEKLKDYKNAVSSKDEKAALDKAIKNEREKYDDLLNVDSTERKNLLKARLKRDEQAIKKHSQDVTAEGKEKQIKEARAKTKAAEKAYAESKTVKNKAKAVAETYKKYNPETAARIQNGKNYLDELFKKKRR